MAVFTITVEDQRGETPEDDSYTCTVIAQTSEDDREEEKGLSMATMIAQHLYYLADNPDKLIEALKDEKLEDIMAVPNQSAVLEA